MATEPAPEDYSKYPEVDRELKVSFAYLQILEKVLKSLEADFETHMNRVKILIYFKNRFDKLAALEEQEIERQELLKQETEAVADQSGKVRE